MTLTFAGIRAVFRRPVCFTEHCRIFPGWCWIHWFNAGPASTDAAPALNQCIITIVGLCRVVSIFFHLAGNSHSRESGHTLCLIDDVDSCKKCIKCGDLHLFSLFFFMLAANVFSHALRKGNHSNFAKYDFALRKWNEMNRALGHLCAHIG